MSGTPRPSVPSTSSPTPERTIPVYRVSLFGYGDGDAYLTHEEPQFWRDLVSTGALPDWLVFETISGAKVAVREESVNHVEVEREVGVDLDATSEEPDKKQAGKRKTKASSIDSVD